MKNRMVWLYGTLVLIAITISSPIFLAYSTSINEELIIDYNTIRESIDMEAIKSHIDYLSSLGSRMTGYPGCDAAAEYIFNIFKEAGLQDVHYQYYNVTVPVDYGAEVQVLAPQNLRIKAYPFMPNMVQTCSTPGISGPLIYAGKGELEDFNGEMVPGSIVLMDFESADNWINAAKLGAQGVIFIEPEITNRFEMMQKINDEIPLHFPRIYISREDGNKLLSLLQSGEAQVNVESKMKYEIRTARNVIGLISGTESPYFHEWKPEWAQEMDFSAVFALEYAQAGPGYYSKDAVAISAHYDSFSYVPSLASGADEATGIAALLELVRYFSINKPRRTIKFVAFSGHWQALEGARQYVEKYWLGLPGIRAHLNLDFSTDNNKLGLVFAGHWGKVLCIGFPPWGEQPLNRARFISDLIFKEYLPAIQEQLNKEYSVDNAVNLEWEKFVPIPYIIDTEPVMLAGTNGLSLYTTRSGRPLMNTPFDTADRVNYANLRPQVELAYFFLDSLVNEPEEIAPVYEVRRWRIMGGFSAIEGRVVEYNFSRGWYQPVSNALVDIKLFSNPVLSAGAGGAMSMMPTAVRFMQHAVVMTDAEGKFSYIGVVGIEPSGAQTVYGGMYTYQYAILPHVIDQENGAILMAPDFGVYGAGRFGSPSVNVDEELERRTFVAFRCASLVAFDMMDSRSFEVINNRIYLLDFEGHELPMQFGLTVTEKPHMMFFMRPGAPVEILIEDNTAQLAMLLDNATDQHPEGIGYTATAIGQTISIRNTAAEAVNSLRLLDDARLNHSRKYGVSNPEVVEFYHRAHEGYKKYMRAMENLQYDIAYGVAITTLQDSIKTYRALRSLMQDASFTIFASFVILIPFAIFFEKLTFEFRGMKRFLAIVIVFAIVFGFLYAFHPGFYIAPNTSVVLIGATVVSLSIPLVIFVLSYVVDFMTTIRKKMMGIHIVEASKVSAAVTAFSIGVSNMRKRRLRTVLLLITLTIITTSFVALTSVSVTMFVRGTKIAETPLYDGIFIRRIIWEPLPWQSVEFIQGSFPDAIVAPRLWFYPQLQTLTLSSPSSTFTISRYAGLMALSPEESEVTDINKTLIEGSWFDASDIYSVILGYQVSDKLKVKVNDTIKMLGLSFAVKGVFDPLKMSRIKELDQRPILPVDMQAGAEGIMAGARLPAGSVVIVPVRFARQNPDFNVHMISIRVPNATKVEEYGLDLGLRTNFDVYAGTGRETYNYRLASLATTQGWETLAFPLAIGMLMVLTTVLGSIHERTREIGVFSSVGLSPRHVAYLFLAEALTYALISSIVGYVAGLVINVSLYRFNLLEEGIYPNSSSSYVIYSILLLSGATIISSIHPLRVASRVVTPSIARLWRIDTEPKENEWTIPMPFVLREKKEIKAVLKYLEEYVITQAAQRSTFFEAEDIKIKEDEFDDAERLSLEMIARIAPWDAGIVQDVRVSATSPKGKNEYNFEIYLHRRSGILTFWQKSNRAFIDELRKQLLLWRGLRPVDRERYFEMVS